MNLRRIGAAWGLALAATAGILAASSLPPANAAPATAPAPAELGMAAPPVKIAHWPFGDPVDITQGRGTNVYVVEFWATWCGPCRVTMPHLTALQKRFKDRGVSVVGISREPLSTVKPFVAKQGDKLGYTIGVDDKDATTQAYMQAFHVPGIPHAFVVDKQGRIAWHGHPMDGLDRVLEDILADRYDLKAAQRATQLGESMNGYFQKVVASGLQAAREDGERFLKDAKSHPDLLNQFAWIVLTHPRLPARDLELATTAAQTACTGDGASNPSFLDTLARAMSMTGKHAEAVSLQKKAIAAATDAPADTKTRLETSLKEYQSKLPQ